LTASDGGHMRLSLTLAVVVGFTVTAQPPQFKSGVQLLTIDASVRDKGGNPVTDLKPTDFTVTIDGKPRTVVFARYFHSEPAAILAASDSTVGHYATNTTPDSAGGHVVVFAIDRNALPPGTERPILANAAAMLDGLSPADSAGLVEIPGRTREVTRDHARIAEMLKSITGMSQPRTSARNVTWDEAKGFERGDRQVIGEVMARECAQNGIGPIGNMCPPEVRVRAGEVLAYERNHAQTLLAGLTAVIRLLEPIRGPKHLVLVSTGLPFDTEFLDRFKMFERAAAEARVTVDTIRIHEFVGDASSDARGGIAFNDLGVHAGMDTLATMTGGRAYAPAGTGAGVFAHIVSDISSFYQLGVESLPGDANGKLHDVKVRVSRPDTETVARPSVAPLLPTPTANLLDTALRQPVDVGSVPISVATYSMFGTSGVNRVVVAAEIGLADSPAPAEWGVVVLHNGELAASTRGRISTGPRRPQIVTTTMELPPGAYRLRVGAVDADGGAGTIEIPFATGAHETPGGEHIGDLMIGVTTGNELEPRSQVADTDEVTAIVQIAGATGETASGTLQFVRGGSTLAAASAPFAAVHKPDGPLTLLATLDAGALTPGRHTAVATMRAGDRTLGRVSRVVEVVPGAVPLPTAAPSPKPSVDPKTPLTSDAPATEIMRRVAAYVERYGEAASVLVGVETYAQKSDEVRQRVTVGRGRGVGPAAPTPVVTSARTLTSELALVRNAAAIGGWAAFRDVTQVDGKPVTDRGSRLHDLFETGAPDLNAAKRIDVENARYNIGPVKRTFNVPTATLFFFTPANLHRFAFRSRGTEPVDGADVLVVEFHETAKPTLVMNGLGKDVPCSGTLWIDPADGHVVKTRLLLTGYAGDRSAASVDVTFRRHPEFDMWVPASMHESYVTGSGSVSGDARYVDFRRFQTSAKIKK
jgi:VWFA-related protein